MPQRKILIPTLVVVLILSLLFIAGHSYLKSRIKRSVDKIEFLDYRNLQINIFKGTLTLDSLRYCPPSDQRIEFDIAKAGLHGFDLFKWLFDNNYQFKHAEFRQAHIWISTPDSTGSMDTIARKTPDNSIHIDKFSLHGNSVYYSNNKNDRFYCKDINLTVDNLNITGKSELDWTNVEVSGAASRYMPGGGLHYLTTDAFSFTGKQQTANIENLRVKCHYSKQQFYRHVHQKSTLSNLDVNKIIIEGANLNSYLENGEIAARKITVDKMNLLAYDDARIPVCTTCYRDLPHEALQKLDIPVQIDTLMVHHADIRYHFRPEDASEIGEITFNDANIEVFNLCNIDSILSRRPSARINASALFMGKARMNLKFEFPMNSPVSHFYWSGEIGQFSLLELNDLFLFKNKLRIKEGNCESYQFQCTGNINEFKGDLAFSYSELDFIMLNNKKKKNPIMTGIFKIITSKKNIAGTGHLKEVEATMKRDPNRSVFYQFAHILQDGMMKTILQ